MFRIHLKPDLPRNYREAFATPDEDRKRQALLNHLVDNGVLLIGTGSGMLSTAMTEREVERLAEAVLAGLKAIF
jgi:glutamate-1-semialdehyde 2,1-aminomutase